VVAPALPANTQMKDLEMKTTAHLQAPEVKNLLSMDVHLSRDRDVILDATCLTEMTVMVEYLPI